MNKNTFSLLSSHWNISDNYESSLYPFLLQIINGSLIGKENQLSETLVNFSNNSLLHFNASAQPYNGQLPKERSVAIIQVHHPIFKYDQTCGPRGTQSIMQILEEFKTNKDIAGVVMDYDSGGGQASGNSEFAEYINEFKKVKPLVSYTNGLLGSAALYMALGSSKIVVNKHADAIGSLGTMLKSLNLEGIIIKKGGTINELYATKSTEKNKISRALKKGDTETVIKELLDPHRDIFEADAREYRPQLKEEVFKGDVFSPQKAIELGLADQLGTLNDAINLVFELAEENNNSNKKNQKMTTKKLTALNGVLGVENLESTDEGVYLNEEQLVALNQNILDQEAAVTTAETSQTTAEDSLTEAENNAAAVTTAIQTALTDAEVEGSTEMSNEEGITAMSELIVEYGANDGAKGTHVPGKTGDKKNKIDMSLAHNKEAYELLKN